MKEMNLLRERFYVDKKTEPVWNKSEITLLQKYELTPLDISMMATVVGYNKKLEFQVRSHIVAADGFKTFNRGL